MQSGINLFDAHTLIWANLSDLTLADQGKLSVGLATQDSLVVLSKNIHCPLKKKLTFTEVCIERTVSFETLCKVADFLSLNLPEQKRSFVKSIFAGKSDKSLSSGLLLIQHADILSAKDIKSLDYLMQGVVLSRDFFFLAKYFFEKKAEPFFRLWFKVQKLYPTQFWISFWANKIWKKVEEVPEESSKFASSLLDLYSLDHFMKNGGSDHLANWLLNYFYV